MNNRGAHGDGHPDNTQTPLIVWGAGAQGPQKRQVDSNVTLAADPWFFDDLVRHDVNQADIAPLMVLNKSGV